MRHPAHITSPVAISAITPKFKGWRRRGAGPVRIALYVLLGAVSTVGVAWVCAVEVQLRDATSEMRSCIWRPSSGSIKGRIDVEHWGRFGSARYACCVMQPDPPWTDAGPFVTPTEARALAPAWSQQVLFDWTDQQHDWPPEAFTVQGVDCRGWPFHALWCAYAWNPETEPDLWYWVTNGGGIELGDGMMPSDPADWWPRAALPCLPIRPGFIADTVVFATCWLVVLAAPGMIRGALRRRRGLCVRCAYDLRATPSGSRCPDCGT